MRFYGKYRRTEGGPEIPPEIVTELPEGGLLATGDDVITIFTLAKIENRERAKRLYEGLSEQAKVYVQKNIEYFSCLK